MNAMGDPTDTQASETTASGPVYDMPTIESVRDGLRSKSGAPLRRLMVANRGVRVACKAS